MSDPGELALFLSIGGALVTLLLGPIGKALAARIAGKRPADERTGLTTGEVVAERLAVMEDRIAELEGERAQLEERLEFAERMLTKGADDRAGLS